MKTNYQKYAELLVKRCLCLNEKVRPLLITAPVENREFVRIVANTAYELGVRDIHFDWVDEELQYDQLKNFEIKDLIKSSFWNKVIYDEYAKKDAAFLILHCKDYNLMKDVEPEKTQAAGKQSRESRPIYKEKQKYDRVPWCIAMAPTLNYAKSVFKTEDPLSSAWDAVFKSCLIYDDNPIETWNEKLRLSAERCNKLNDRRFKFLHITNRLGTNLKLELPDKHIWLGAGKKNEEGLELIVNMPTEEIFTTLLREKTEGIAYSSKPLVYEGTVINNFSLRFEEGKVIEVKTEKGEEILKKMLEMDSNASYLGEIALVNDDSPISNMGIIFYDTLYDENASCHLALGSGFPNTYENGETMTKEELSNAGINDSLLHTDFMIGTPDLKIVGITISNEEIIIFDEGNFVL